MLTKSTFYGLISTNVASTMLCRIKTVLFTPIIQNKF